jgi:hypothetical protein
MIALRDLVRAQETRLWKDIDFRINSNWQSGVLNPDGKIYIIPRDSQSVLMSPTSMDFNRSRY